jgi:hypothetical protein
MTFGVKEFVKMGSPINTDSADAFDSWDPLEWDLTGGPVADDLDINNGKYCLDGI